MDGETLIAPRVAWAYDEEGRGAACASMSTCRATRSGLTGSVTRARSLGEEPLKHRICIQRTFEEVLHMLAPKSAEIVHRSLVIAKRPHTGTRPLRFFWIA